jgi:hypothetical protein
MSTFLDTAFVKTEFILNHTEPAGAIVALLPLAILTVLPVLLYDLN